MRNKSMGRYLVYSLIGFIILSLGAVFAKSTRNEQGFIYTLPYLLIGIGSGIFGQNLGSALNIRAMKKSPQLAKQHEIAENDERNIAIITKSKAKAFDLMVIVFGVLMMVFALIQTDWKVILTFVIAYLFVLFSKIYFVVKYQKEM